MTTAPVIAPGKAASDISNLWDFINAAPEAFLLTDAGLCVRAANAAAADLLRAADPEALSGLDLIEVIPGLFELKDELLGVVAGQGPMFLAELPLDGDPEGTLGTLKIFQAGDGLGLIVADLTELRDAMAEARKFNQFLQQVIASAAVCMCVIDPEFNVVLWNRAMEEMTGYHFDEVLGGSQVWEKLFPEPESRQVFLERLRGVFAGESLKGIEITLSTRTGEKCVINWYCSRVCDDGGSPVAAMIIGLDITARKRLEEQLIQAQKMQAVGTLASGVAHDFNNLLMAIIGDAELAMQAIAPEHAAREWLEDIMATGQRASDLTRQLLLFCRKEQGIPKPINLNNSIQGMSKLLDRLLGRQVQVIHVLDPKLDRILADEGHVEQVILNLCINARDAMPGGGRITLITQNLNLDKGSPLVDPQARPGRFVCLSIVDTGTGMPPEVVKRIFEPFYTTKPAGQGTGLGLAVVYGVVKELSGWVSVSSKSGKGSVFEIYLPSLGAKPETGRAATTLPEAAKREVKRGKGQHIMLVEDEPSISRSLSMALRLYNYEVSVAETLAEARNLLERDGLVPDLLISDVVLPDGNGLTLAEELHVKMPDLPILISTGFPGRGGDKAVPINPAFQLLHKPYKISVILETVHNLLNPE